MLSNLIFTQPSSHTKITMSTRHLINQKYLALRRSTQILVLYKREAYPLFPFHGIILKKEPATRNFLIGLEEIFVIFPLLNRGRYFRGFDIVSNINEYFDQVKVCATQSKCLCCMLDILAVE